MEFMEERSLFSQTSLQHKSKIEAEDQRMMNRLSFKERPQLSIIQDKPRFSNLDALGNLNIKSIESAKY